jgi:hypothetical protein
MGMQLATISGVDVALDPRVTDALLLDVPVPLLTLGEIDAIKTKRTEQPICRACRLPVVIARWPGDDRRFYFRHRPGDYEACLAMGGGDSESPEHEELKIRIAQSAKRRGHRVAIEVAGDGCRADVVITTGNGTAHPFEAQLAPLSAESAIDRDRRYESSFGKRATWVHTGRRPWDRTIPSLQVDSGTRSVVTGGVFTDNRLEEQEDHFSLDLAVGGVCGDRLLYIYGAQDGGFGAFFWRSETPKRTYDRKAINEPTGSLGQILCPTDDVLVAAEAIRRKHVDQIDGLWSEDELTTRTLCGHCGNRPRSSFSPDCIQCISEMN